MTVAFPSSGIVDPTTGGRRAGNWGIGSNDIRIRNAILITQSLQCKCNWLHLLFNVEQYQNTY